MKLKSYILQIVIVVVFITLFAISQFLTNEELSKLFFFHGILDFLENGNTGTIANNEKLDLQTLLLGFFMTIALCIADYFRHLIYPEPYWRRMFTAWIPVLIVFIATLIIIGSSEDENIFIGDNETDYWIFNNDADLVFFLALSVIFLFISGSRVLDGIWLKKKLDDFLRKLITRK